MLYRKSIFILSLASILLGGPFLPFVLIMIAFSVKVTPLLDSVGGVLLFLFSPIAFVTAVCAAALAAKRDISGKLKSLVRVAIVVATIPFVMAVLQAMVILDAYLKRTGN